MFTNHPRSRSSSALAFVFTPLTPGFDTPSISVPVGSSVPVYGTTPPRSPASPAVPVRARSQSQSALVSPPQIRPRINRTRFRASSISAQSPPFMSSSRSPFTFTPFVNVNASGEETPRPRSPGSPPPYSVTPPELDPNSPFLAKRAASSPHLHSPPSSPASYQAYSHLNNDTSRYASPSSSSALSAHHHAFRPRHPYSPHTDTSDDPDTDTSPEDTIIYTSSHATLAGTLRARLLGTSKCNRADEFDRVRPITTAPGVIGAGETETEGEDYYSPRNLPTARITPSTNTVPFLASLSNTTMSHLPSPPRSLIQPLFEFSRLMSVLPAFVGTVYNLYHVFFPPVDGLWSRIEYFISVLWAILTGWQCLKLTTGLLKRWRVYYSPLPTLIRLLGLQAICWPATHLTLTVLEHEKRPLICWAVIATTTCCSRSIQMWVTSNIIVTHPHSHQHTPSHNHSHHNPTASSSSVGAVNGAQSSSTLNGAENTSTKERMRMGRRRKWDWSAVGRECALPAGVIYFLMAWMVVLRREFEGR